MNKTYVYKITRMDGKEYIGITIRLKVRFRNHELSERFKMGIKRFSILAVCDTYDEAAFLEEKYISKWNTFYEGLNESIDGKGNHLAPRFNTLGYKFSDESRAKMRKNHWSKTGSYIPPKGRVYSEQTRKGWSETRKGVYWGGRRKIPVKDWPVIYDNYIKDDMEYPKEFIAKHVKKSQVDGVLKDQIPKNELRTKNGKDLTNKVLFVLWHAEQYDIAPSAIRTIIKRKGIATGDPK